MPDDLKYALSATYDKTSFTKRPERLLEFSNQYEISKNVWVGTSVENQENIYRANILKKVKAHIHFLSCEPLLGQLSDLALDNIQWVVVGGESGSGARPVEKEWIIELRDKCEQSNVPFFFKQWGGWNKKKNGHELDGKIYKRMPEV